MCDDVLHFPAFQQGETRTRDDVKHSANMQNTRQRHQNMYLEGVIFKYRAVTWSGTAKVRDNQIGSELYMFRYYPKSLLSATEFLSKM